MRAIDVSVDFVGKNAQPTRFSVWNPTVGVAEWEWLGQSYRENSILRMNLQRGYTPVQRAGTALHDAA